MSTTQNNRDGAVFFSQSNGHESKDALDFLRRLIDSQKELHDALARADADAISAAAAGIEAILVDCREIKTSSLLPEQIRMRTEARVLVGTVMEWQNHNRELGRHSLRILRRLCGVPTDPSYDASGRLDETSTTSTVGIYG